MNMKNTLLLVFLSFIYQGWSQQTDPVMKAVRLELETDSVNDLKTTILQDRVVEIKTLGNDPWIYTKPMQQVLSRESAVLSFEYFCAKGLDHLEIYFYPKGGKVHSKLISRIGQSEGWVEYSVDLGNDLAGWGNPGDFLRLDFGSIPGISLQVRNLTFRSRTARELELAASYTQKKKNEAVLETNLKAYLAKEYSSSITNVSVSGNSITIIGKLVEKDKLFLCEVPPYLDVTEEQSFAAVIPVSGKDFKINTPRYADRNGSRYDRLLSKWVLAKKSDAGYTLISHARYAE
jgi:hypothetical protein